MLNTRDATEVLDEIALNPQTFEDRTIKEILSTLVHEMVHLEQAHFGSPSRNGYHREWAELMESRPGAIRHRSPGGKRPGQRMSHYVAEDGRSRGRLRRASSWCHISIVPDRATSPARNARPPIPAPSVRGKCTVSRE